MRTKETLPQLLLKGEINSTTPHKNSYICTQLAQGHSRTLPTSELLQDVRGKYNPNIRTASRCEEKSILTSELLQDVRTKENLSDLLLREINGITIKNYIWTQLAWGHSRTPPSSELLQDMGEIYNPNIRIASRCEKNSRNPPTSELLHNVREKA